eukprot:CAMPEP_0206260538 /NCGR_PEP_ID=MMETSP0047_2-20121206/27150_1 /ASSEMBLY_ACC=CAM_ASM_000192 /TAXON_ID=195065 /ORGANISM="Chroomonas mesostigmatica_cf, Strain CCMP1168" /LENGTH=75 /DNA_ID=CAMNT_0053687643 /DNA_START=241 /DNA_END=465 /DNA_ORIENTATION=+
MRRTSLLSRRVDGKGRLLLSLARCPTCPVPPKTRRKRPERRRPVHFGIAAHLVSFLKPQRETVTKALTRYDDPFS